MPHRIRYSAALAALWLGLAAAQAPPRDAYFPEANGWQRKSAVEAGFDEAALRQAIDIAIAHESRSPRDLTLSHYQTFGREPHGHAIGPIKDRGDMTGVIVHRGYLVAEWGEPARVDMTYSVTKSMISTVVGIAVDRGLIRSIDDAVRDYVSAPIQVFNGPLVYLFETPHNRTITWDHLLRQTSDWEGTLWGKPDWADRPSDNRAEWTTRPRSKPGTAYKYNDVRVNVLALAALNVWRRPLPQVLRENVMDPIGASSTWRWFGYENSYVVLDGEVMQSVSGGGHWGGGLFVNGYDMARFGLLTLHKGRWKDRQLVSARWIDRALTPTPAEPRYGFMNFYNNRDQKLLPSAPPSSFAHIGNGTNIVVVIPDRELVIVLRWIQTSAIDDVVRRILAALK